MMTGNTQTQQIYQRTMSKTLEKIIHTDDIQEAFSDVFHDILDYFRAGRVAVMSTDRRDPSLQYCVFEVTAPGVSSSMKGREDQFPKHPWWYSKLEAGECVVVNDVETHLWDDPSALHLLESLDVRAHLGVPIIRYNKISGFLAIDITDRPYHWSEGDILWLKDIANMMMLWRRLQRKRTDAASERNKLHKVLTDMPVGLCLYDTDGNITFANERALSVFGVKSLEEARAFNIFRSKLLTEEIKRRIREEDIVDTSFEYSYGVLPSDQGQTDRGQSGKGQSFAGDHVKISVLARYSKLYDYDGALKAYLVAYVDQTRELNNSVRIRELDEIISVTADFAQLGYARINVLTNTGYATRQWYKNNNMDMRNSAMGISDFPIMLHPDDRKASDDYRRRAVEGSVKCFNHRCRVKAGGEGGGWDWLQVYSVVTKWEPQNGCVEISTLTQNINRQMEMERKLVEAKETAEEADKLKSAFLANMSHEIRTPLNAIVGFSQLLCHDDVPGNEREEMCKIVEENNDLLLQIISDILDLAKLESGTLAFIPKETDVSDVCKSVAAAIEMRVKEGVKVRLDCQKDKFTIVCDPNRLKQVLLNFGTNAAKFTSQGSITIGYFLARKDRLHFFVEDTGIGIAPDKKAKVFERFVKLNKFVQGTGLGLQISKEIVTRMNGEIGVESEPGEGATFWFEIPV
ncbi:MAG: ATP-binding protein [Prevotella sp.]|nr:ATP-binding protein [Prevotella sp.]